MRNKRFVLTNLKCNNCGEVVVIPRKIGKQKQMGHIKDMWCPYCNKETQFTEMKNYVKNGLGEEIYV